MLLISILKEHTQTVVEGLRKKHVQHADVIVAELLELDQQRRALQTESDALAAESNQIAKQIGQWIQQGDNKAVQEAKTRTVTLKQELKQLAELLSELEKTLETKLIQLPNLPHISVPEGRSAEDNLEERREGKLPELGPDALPHWDLCSKYDIVDFELGTKITGAGFPIYKGQGARLQRALINFFIDKAVEAGYVEIQPPLMVNEASAYATGQLPDKDGQMYHMPVDGFYMIPTAEVPVTNIYRQVMLAAEQLPVKNVAYSSCFRREAGSYGKDVRGLNRLHQFDKIEIVQIAHPDHSYEVLEQMKDHVCDLLRALELPFRILRLCGGDMSFTSALTFDFEVYSAAQQRWLEVSSVSNFETYQANRMKCRFKDENGKTRLVHTLNGSAMALPRIVAALLENHQTPEGIRIPKALQAYTGFECIR